MDVIDLVVPSRVRAYIGKVGPRIGHAALSGVAKQTVEEPIVAVVKVVIDADMALKSIINRRLVNRYIP